MRRAGLINQRITIQTNTPTRGTDGASLDSWADTATVWAQKVNQGSREFEAAHKVNSETTDLFIIRYRSGITTKNRVKYGTRLYNIIGAPDPDGGQVKLQLLCKEVL
jgi:SPP1 family predicted phage head-tail adaptor